MNAIFVEQEEIFDIVSINDKVPDVESLNRHHMVPHPRSPAVEPALKCSASEQDPGSGWTALHFACLRGNVQIVKELLKFDADVGALDSPYCQVSFFFFLRLYLQRAYNTWSFLSLGSSALHFQIKDCVGGVGW